MEAVKYQDWKVNRMAIKEFRTGSRKIPYYHFVYEGSFYKDLRARNRIFTDGTRVNSFFNNQTFVQHDFERPYVRFQKAALFLIHHFPDQRERDLDNCIYKPVIDALRKTGIFPDDSWQHLSLFLFGDCSEKEKIEAFLVPHDGTVDFMRKCLGGKFNSRDGSEVIYPENEQVIQTSIRGRNRHKDHISFW